MSHEPQTRTVNQGEPLGVQEGEGPRVAQETPELHARVAGTPEGSRVALAILARKLSERSPFDLGHRVFDLEGRRGLTYHEAYDLIVIGYTVKHDEEGQYLCDWERQRVLHPEGVLRLIKLNQAYERHYVNHLTNEA